MVIEEPSSKGPLSYRCIAKQTAAWVKLCLMHNGSSSLAAVLNDLSQKFKLQLDKSLKNQKKKKKMQQTSTSRLDLRQHTIAIKLQEIQPSAIDLHCLIPPIHIPQCLQGTAQV